MFARAIIAYCHAMAWSVYLGAKSFILTVSLYTFVVLLVLGDTRDNV